MAELPTLMPLDRVQFMLHREFAFARLKWPRAGLLQRTAASAASNTCGSSAAIAKCLKCPDCAVVWTAAPHLALVS